MAVGRLAGTGGVTTGATVGIRLSGAHRAQAPAPGTRAQQVNESHAERVARRTALTGDNAMGVAATVVIRA